MKITTGTAAQDMDIAAGVPFLQVPWQITETQEATADQPAGEVVLLEGVQAFPLSVSEQEIKDFLARKLQTYQENVALHEGAKELQAGINNATEVAAQVTNISLSETSVGEDNVQQNV